MLDGDLEEPKWAARRIEVYHEIARRTPGLSHGEPAARTLETVRHDTVNTT